MDAESKFHTSRPAVMSWSLYLVNLLLLPGAAFIGLVWYWSRHHGKYAKQVNQHINWALRMSFVSGGLLLIIPTVTLLVFGTGESVIMGLLLYLVTAHASSVLPGIYGLAKAMAMKKG